MSFRSTWTGNEKKKGFNPPVERALKLGSGTVCKCLGESSGMAARGRREEGGRGCEGADVAAVGESPNCTAAQQEPKPRALVLCGVPREVVA